MKKIYWLLTIFLLTNLWPIRAQTVINTEDLRLRVDTQRVMGLVNFDFGMSRNKAGRFLRPGLDFRLEANKNQHRWLVLGGYALTRFTDIDIPGASAKNFNNRGFVHLRYSRSLNDHFALEGFTQYQFDEIQEIDQRILTGGGIRYRAVDSDRGYFFIGATYMYEYERTSAEEEGLVFNKHHRISMYLSGGAQFNEHVRINSTTYFQPRPDVLSDYRISTVNSLTADLSDQLGLRLQINLIYDARPPLSVPRLMYDTSAGFTVNW